MAPIKVLARYLSDNLGVDRNTTIKTLKKFKKTYHPQQFCPEPKKIEPAPKVCNTKPEKLYNRVVRFKIPGIVSRKTENHGILHFHLEKRIVFNRDPFYAYGVLESDGETISELTTAHIDWLERKNINHK